MGAAPSCRRTRGHYAAAAVATTLATIAFAAAAAAPTSSAGPSAGPNATGIVWGVELPANKSYSAAQLARLRRQGVNTVVVDPARVRAPGRLRTLSNAARRGGMFVSMPRTSSARLAARCWGDRKGAARSCSVLARTPRSALSLARRNVADFIVFRLMSLRQMRRLTGARSRTRILAVARLSARKLDRNDWRRAVELAAGDPSLDLVVSIRSMTQPSLKTYLSLVRAAGVPGSPRGALPPSPPGPVNVLGVTSTTVVLSWGPASRASSVAGYGIYRNGVSVATVHTPLVTIADLTCGTNYTFSVDAFDNDGNRSSQVSVVIATSACGGAGGSDALPPSAPLGLAVTTRSQSSITLGWTASTDNIGVEGYVVYRGANLVSSTVLLTSTVSGLACGTSYTFAVEAYDAAGNRSPRTSVTAATNACAPGGDTTPPSEPGGLTWTSATTTTMTLSWNASADNVGVTGYGVYRGGTLRTSVTGTTATLTGLTCGTSYSVGVDAFDAAGNRSSRTSINAPTSSCPADTQSPSAPAGFGAIGATATSVTASWSASSDNVGVAGYGLYQEGSLIGSTSGTSHTFTGLACGTSYSLGVDAFDAAGNRSLLATLNASTSSCGSTPPTNGMANLWVDTNGGSCVRQSSPGGYGDGQACGSMNAAYQAAAAGDTILIKGGTYGDQNVANRSSLALGSAPVVFHPAPGESVTINDGMTIWTHDVVLDGGDRVGVNEANRFRVTGEPNSQGGRSIDVESRTDRERRNVVVEDVHTRNVYYTADYSVFRYSEVGPSNACTDLVLSGDEPVYGWVIEYNLIHDNNGGGCGGAHIDGLDLYVVDGVVRGNRIWWCGTQCVFVGDPGSLLIENNMIEETNACGSGCAGPQELAIMGTNTVRYNTIEGDDGYGLADRPGNSTVYGNIFLSPYNGCAGGTNVTVTYDYNVFAAGSSGCGTNRKSCTPRLADGSLYTNVDRQADYHLAANDTCALGAGKPGAHPAIDIDEASRPSGGEVDAGADER